MTGFAMNWPLFSVVIPTYNRPARLRACLDAFRRLDYPGDRFEVIVVDDGSEMPPDAMVSSFKGELDLTLLRRSHLGPASARNAGAAYAKGEFLAFTDDDCTPVRNWLQALATRFAQHPDSLVGGRTQNALPANVYSTASSLLVAYVEAYYARSRGSFFTSNNLALPAGPFRAIGGFDITFPRAGAEDRELCERWLNHGYRMVEAPEVVVHHTHSLALRTFWGQHFSYGRGAFRLHEIRVLHHQSGIRLEPPRFYLNLLRLPFSVERGHRALQLTALLLSSQVANAMGFAWEAVRRATEQSRE